jgi:hypothetical protein
MPTNSSPMVQTAHTHSTPRSLASHLALAAILVTVGLAGKAVAQDEPPLPVDPTPLAQLLSASERALVAGAPNPKKLIDVYLNISDAHLDAANKGIDAGDNAASEKELDIYNKACAEAARLASSAVSGKRDLTKKVEQRLYVQLKMLELIERKFPANRVAFPVAAIEKTKRLRARALNETIGSGDVLTDPAKKPESHAPPGGKPPKPGPVKPLYLLGIAGPMLGQMPGDYLTEQEDKHVREAQRIDDRMKVFMKIADRRLDAITGAAPTPAEKKPKDKKLEKQENDWGAVPSVSRAELLRHYARAIEEAINKLEDAHERNPKSSAIPKALIMLKDASERHLQTLHSLEAQMTSDAESGALRGAISQAETANEGAKEGLKSK